METPPGQCDSSPYISSALPVVVNLIAGQGIAAIRGLTAVIRFAGDVSRGEENSPGIIDPGMT